MTNKSIGLKPWIIKLCQSPSLLRIAQCMSSNHANNLNIAVLSNFDNNNFRRQIPKK